MMHTLRFHVSDRSLELRTQDHAAHTALAAVWESCAEPMVPTSRAHLLEVRPEGPRVRLWLDGERSGRTVAPDALLPSLDLAIYEQLADWSSPGRALLHGACLVGATASVLITGPSGAGKSSLAWAGIQRGYHYACDEIAVSDGASVWGISRAVLYDLAPEGGVLPPWIEGADTTAYRLLDNFGRRCALPLRKPPRAQIVRAPWPCARTHIVVARRGPKTRLGTLDPLLALHLLYQERWGDEHIELRDLVHRDRCFELEWSEPAAAWDLLAPQIGPPPAPAPTSARGR
jgi:hypothetical protein